MTNDIIKIENLRRDFKVGSETVHALRGISFSIRAGEFVTIMGTSGSGKSTLVQHLNGLLKATEGAIYFNGENIYQEKYDLRGLRTQVGMVFQYPEHQLFEETVERISRSAQKIWGFPRKKSSGG